MQEITPPPANSVPKKSSVADEAISETSPPFSPLENTLAKHTLQRPKQKLEMVSVKQTRYSPPNKHEVCLS